MVCKSKGAANHVLLLHGVLLIIALNEASATIFQVGGSQGWTVPNNPTTQPYNQWAEHNRFQIGDSLLFVYQANSDSVLQVSKEDYDNCNTASPIATFSDGRTTLAQPGPYYFISGVEQNCKNNEKLVIIVLADRTKKASAPAPAAVPPPPAGSPPPPPPSETVPTTPAASSPPASPPPPQQSPNTNGALSSTVTSKFLTGFGVILGSIVLAM